MSGSGWSKLNKSQQNYRATLAVFPSTQKRSALVSPSLPQGGSDLIM